MKEHIQILEDAASFLNYRGFTAYADSIAAAISYIRDTSEMLEAAGRIELNNGVELGTIERDWDFDSRSWVVLPDRSQLRRLHDSALDAWREVKEKR